MPPPARDPPTSLDKNLLRYNTISDWPHAYFTSSLQNHPSHHCQNPSTKTTNMVLDLFSEISPSNTKTCLRHCAKRFAQQMDPTVEADTLLVMHFLLDANVPPESTLRLQSLQSKIPLPNPLDNWDPNMVWYLKFVSNQTFNLPQGYVTITKCPTEIQPQKFTSIHYNFR